MREVRSWTVIAGVLLLAACRQHGEKATTEQAAGDPQEGEIAIALGDCAPVTTPFVSGPEPQQFEVGSLSTPKTSLYASMADGGDVSASLREGDSATDHAFGSTKVASGALSSSYLPGTASPLQNIRISLRDCFRRQDKRYAAVVFDLGPQSLVAHGLAAPAFDRCIAELASQINVTERSRCSVVFGSATAGVMPGVDITADAITMNGKTLAKPAEVMAGDAKPWWKLEAIFEAAAARVRTTLTSIEPLTIDGPLVIRPLPTTPMKVVTKLVYTLVAAGEDPILAAQRSGQWELLRDRPLPVVPVPVGTGASWSSDRDRVRGTHAADDKNRAYVSLLVTNKDVWVGVSATDGAWVADAGLAAQLAKQKAALSDRTDLEIAATGEVPYSRLVEVIDRARAAGFTEWSLMAKRNLSAPPAETKVNAR